MIEMTKSDDAEGSAPHGIAKGRCLDDAAALALAPDDDATAAAAAARGAEDTRGALAEAALEQPELIRAREAPSGAEDAMDVNLQPDDDAEAGEATGASLTGLMPQHGFGRDVVGAGTEGEAGASATDGLDAVDHAEKADELLSALKDLARAAKLAVKETSGRLSCFLTLQTLVEFAFANGASNVRGVCELFAETRELNSLVADDESTKDLNLVAVLVRKRNLEHAIGNLSNLINDSPDLCIISAARKITGFPDKLTKLHELKKAYEAEEPTRNSTEYEQALEVHIEERRSSGNALHLNEIAQFKYRDECLRRSAELQPGTNLWYFNDGMRYDPSLHDPDEKQTAAAAAGADGDVAQPPEKKLRFEGDCVVYEPCFAAVPGVPYRAELGRWAAQNPTKVADLLTNCFCVCYCWGGIAMIPSYTVDAVVNMHLLGSTLQQPLAIGLVGPAFRALSEIVLVKLSLNEVSELKAKFSDDDDRHHVLLCTASAVQLDTSAVLGRWRQSFSPTGGRRIDPFKSLVVVGVHSSHGEHRFVQRLTELCPKRLAQGVSGLNQSGVAIHYLPTPINGDPILKMVPDAKECILFSATRSNVQVEVSTKEQHDFIRDVLGDGSSRSAKVRLYHKTKGGNRGRGYEILGRQADRTAEQATDCVRDGLLDKLKTEGYGNHIAAIIFQLKSAPDAEVYLQHRLGAAKIAELRSLAKTLQTDEANILKRLGVE
ncbi:hypothetical protein M885DRAFT_574994 [Pelagophyceae sp. CCMP2097]|nr:hypothetical protein M885DRAFT_574994 [Pelagophyceae sp. CCMP2097]